MLMSQLGELAFIEKIRRECAFSTQNLSLVGIGGNDLRDLSFDGRS